MQLELLATKIPLPDLTIGQAMDIAKIPQRYNEKRISALITHLTDDKELANYLTVQERYYLLINHLSLADNKYVEDIDYSRYFLTEKNAPDFVELDGITINHLLGRHVELLERQCENVFDFISGAIACQFTGNIAQLLNLDIDEEDSEIWQWQSLAGEELKALKDDELNNIVMERCELIANLNECQYNQLADIYYSAVEMLAHFVELSFDNKGITVIPQTTEEEQGGAGEIMPVRFLSLAHLRGTAKSIAECVI